MPTYQYACTSEACGLRFERVQAFTDSAITECPECNDRVRKVYGTVGVVFKGSGFYRNDSRDTKTGAAAKTDSDGATATKGADAGKSAESSKGDSGASSGKADSSSGSGTAGDSKSNGKSTSSSKAAATAAS